MVRIDPTAEASLAAIRERSKFGIAIAAMMRMIATTINNSISEKPFCFLFIFSPGSQSSETRLFCTPCRGTFAINAKGVPNSITRFTLPKQRNYILTFHEHTKAGGRAHQAAMYGLCQRKFKYCHF